MKFILDFDNLNRAALFEDLDLNTATKSHEKFPLSEYFLSNYFVGKSIVNNKSLIYKEPIRVDYQDKFFKNELSFIN